MAIYPQLGKGSAERRKSIPFTRLKELPVPLPSLNEQQRIVAILDKADELRTKRRQALSQLDSLSCSVFQAMFAGQEWPVYPLGDYIAESMLGLVRAADDFGPEFDTPYIRMDAISQSGELLWGKVQSTSVSKDEAEKYLLRRGDFLLNTRNSRELVGKTAVYDRDDVSVFNNNILRMRFDARLSPDYVASFMQTPAGRKELARRKVGTTSVYAMYQKDFMSIPVPIPSVDLQDLFGQRVAKIRMLKAMHRNDLAKLDSLFGSLLHRAFSGQL